MHFARGITPRVPTGMASQIGNSRSREGAGYRAQSVGRKRAVRQAKSCLVARDERRVTSDEIRSRVIVFLVTRLPSRSLGEGWSLVTCHFQGRFARLVNAAR